MESRDREQVLGAVVAALGRSASRVADCSYDSSQEFDTQQRKNDRRSNPASSQQQQQRQHHLFSCFTSGKTKTVSSSSSSWPRSPSHIMSRLLLSPSMSPDNRILAGDQSPARGSSSNGHKLRSFTFSGRDAGRMGKNRKPQPGEREMSSTVIKGEPTSPEVTCMGTVKAPKSKKSSKSGSARPLPRWQGSQLPRQQQQQQQQHHQESLLDLSRFGSKSGELRRSKQQQQQQQQASSSCRDERRLSSGPPSLSRCKESSSGNCRVLSSPQEQWCALRSRLDVEVAAVSSEPRDETCSSSISPPPPPPPLKRPDEVCIWRRRCVPEPLRLDIIGSSSSQQKSIEVNGCHGDRE